MPNTKTISIPDEIATAAQIAYKSLGNDDELKTFARQCDDGVERWGIMGTHHDAAPWGPPCETTAFDPSSGMEWLAALAAVSGAQPFGQGHDISTIAPQLYMVWLWPTQQAAEQVIATLTPAVPDRLINSSPAHLLALLRRAQAERDQLVTENLKLESRLTIAEVAIHTAIEEDRAPIWPACDLGNEPLGGAEAQPASEDRFPDPADI